MIRTVKTSVVTFAVLLGPLAAGGVGAFVVEPRRLALLRHRPD
jgi:hypothetical protein